MWTYMSMSLFLRAGHQRCRHLEMQRRCCSHWRSVPALQNKGPFRGPCNTAESHRVFCCLHGTRPDDLPSRSGLEFHRLLSEGINALARLGGGLLNDDELCKARNQKDAGLLELFIANGRERLHDALNIFLCQLVRMLCSNFLNQLRLRHQLWHLCLLPIRIEKLT